jgi:photosystem II stability/assembly factor-like uncharacterized protein
MSRLKGFTAALIVIVTWHLSLLLNFEADANSYESREGWRCSNGKKIAEVTENYQTANARAFAGSVSTELRVSGISVPDQENVWILAQKGDEKGYTHSIILHSTDEGVTWRRQKLDDERYAHEVYFRDRSNGWVAGADGLLIRSTDAGKTWSKRRAPTHATLMWVQFAGRCGWIAGESGAFLRTTDDGNTWQSHRLAGHGWVGDEFRGWLTAFGFSDQLHGWFVGEQNKVFGTTDGGQTWRSRVGAVEECVAKDSVRKRKRTINLTGVHFFSSRRGILAADVVDKTSNGNIHHAVLLKTEDAGRNWRTIWSFEAGSLRCLNFINEFEGWMTTTSLDRNLVRTTDGGRSWLGQDVPGVDINSLLTGGLFQLRMIDSKRGWAAVGVNDFPALDKIVKTTDGGRTWVDVKLNSEREQ